jgi:hypothetical protein
MPQSKREQSAEVAGCQPDLVLTALIRFDCDRLINRKLIFYLYRKRNATGHKQTAPLGCHIHYMTLAIQMAFPDCLTKLKQTKRRFGVSAQTTARVHITNHQRPYSQISQQRSRVMPSEEGTDSRPIKTHNRIRSSRSWFRASSIIKLNKNQLDAHLF